jgi:hypothetical protein
MEWFESWFDTPYYHLLYSNRDYTEAENFITKLTTDLQLPPQSGSLILSVERKTLCFSQQIRLRCSWLDLSRQSIESDKQY